MASTWPSNPASRYPRIGGPSSSSATTRLCVEAGAGFLRNMMIEAACSPARVLILARPSRAPTGFLLDTHNKVRRTKQEESHVRTIEDVLALLLLSRFFRAARFRLGHFVRRTFPRNRVPRGAGVCVRFR